MLNQNQNRANIFSTSALKFWMMKLKRQSLLVSSVINNRVSTAMELHKTYISQERLAIEMLKLKKTLNIVKEVRKCVF